MPNIGVLAIQGDVREHATALTACGATVSEVRTAAAIAQVDGLVIPGGESTTMSILANKNNLFAPLRAAARAGMPMYGSCAGLIMLADRIADGRPDQETIGGLDITAARNAFGRQIDSFETDVSMPALGAQPYHAVFIRAPLVMDAGPEVEVLATVSRDGEDRPVAVRQGRLLATSFHPELTSDLRVHQLFIDTVRTT